MKIKYLGTSAAEGIPALFCACPLCALARKEGGKNVRTRSQALIDNKILIDFGPDTNLHALKYNLELYKIQSCLLTHAHSDHLYIDDIKNRKSGFAHFEENIPPLTFYASEKVSGIVKDFIINQDLDKENRVFSKTVTPFKAFGAEDYCITPLPANHAENTGAVIYMIKKGEKTLLYAHDTGLFSEEIWEFFNKTKPYFDFVSLDCTGGNKQMNYAHHMNVERCCLTKKKMLSLGIADKNTVFCLNHFSHNGLDCSFEAFSAIAEKCGFITSFDGMEVDF